MVATATRFRLSRLAASVVLGVGAVALWSACSVEKDYALLSTFFDGVPEPTPEGVEGPAADDAAGPDAAPMSSHSAYVERRCAACHGDRASFGFFTTGFSDVDGAICTSCHAEVTEGFAHLHGPVAANLCLVCHEAHVSSHPSLLVGVSPSLCLGCHGTELEAAPLSTPGHADLERDCLDCHGSHGGIDEYLLLPPPTSGAVPEP